QDSGRIFAVLLPLVMLWVAARSMQLRDLGRQMMVRAITWSSLVIGVLIATVGFSEYAWCGTAIALGSGAALLSLRGWGLGITSAVFRPIAFRTQLLVALVLAMADAQTLLFSGLVEVASLRMPPLPGLPVTVVLLQWGAAALSILTHPALLAGALMLVVVAGISRLRTWALLLNVVANLAIAALALDGTLHVSPPVALAVTATATIQLLLPVPILAAMLGARGGDRRPLGRWGPRVAVASIAGLMLAGLLGPAMPDQLGLVQWRVGWVQRAVRTDFRGATRAPSRQTDNELVPAPPRDPGDGPSPRPAAGGAR
ncbi:MAG: hypothetical protein K0V04_20725, partial [Deltaproteobacteria bacterium]|nr:hypothetical protein [Deltaproteobacteria bacterium]